MTARTKAGAALCAILSSFASSAVIAGDGHNKGEESSPVQSMPAVDGVSAKASGFGGAGNGNGLYGGLGSVSVPLGFRYGLQFDGAIANIDTDTQGEVTIVGTAAHLFWRDPSAGLFGLYGDYLHADAFSGVDVVAGAVEGAVYLGRFTLEGVVGAQGGQADLGPAGRVDSDTRIFDVARLAYYPVDNLKLSIGHSYLFGKHAAQLGAEWDSRPRMVQ